jgi:formate hydrogenlyase subunit 3/multisubunit Na+/H+ antiporter MnhD subunit
MRAFQKIWWFPHGNAEQIKTAGDRLIAPALLILLVIALGLWAQPLIEISQDTSLWLQDPLNYIQSVLGSSIQLGLGGG